MSFSSLSPLELGSSLTCDQAVVLPIVSRGTTTTITTTTTTTTITVLTIIFLPFDICKLIYSCFNKVF